MARKKKYELPSGTLRKQVYDHSEPVFDSKGKPVLLPDGKQKMKRVYISITAYSKTELNLKVSQYKATQKKHANLLKREPISFRDAIGIPDQYIMERGGWSSDEVLKRIYRGTMSDYRKKFIEQTNEHFEKCNTKCNTNFKNP